MRRISHRFTDAKGGYCALGAYAKYLGAEDLELGHSDLNFIDTLRNDKHMPPLKFSAMHEILQANDSGDIYRLNELLKLHDLPIRAAIYANDWVVGRNQVEHFDEQFKMVIK